VSSPTSVSERRAEILDRLGIGLIYVHHSDVTGLNPAGSAILAPS
jgi:hypothetical protein